MSDGIRSDRAGGFVGRLGGPNARIAVLGALMALAGMPIAVACRRCGRRPLQGTHDVG